MKSEAVIPEADILKKLRNLKTEDKGEFIVKAVKYGNNIYVSVCTFDGLIAFHPPYVIYPNGKHELMEPDNGRIQKVFDKGTVLYYDPYIKRRKLSDVL